MNVNDNTTATASTTAASTALIHFAATSVQPISSRTTTVTISDHLSRGCLEISSLKLFHQRGRYEKPVQIEKKNCFTYLD